MIHSQSSVVFLSRIYSLESYMYQGGSDSLTHTIKILIQFITICS